MGRLIGESVHSSALLSEDEKTEFDAGKFALLGAAAMLAGVTRMTLALAVLLVEVTKDIDAMLYIMTTLAVAKMVRPSGSLTAAPLLSPQPSLPLHAPLFAMLSSLRLG